MDILKVVMDEQKKNKQLERLGGRIRFLRLTYGLSPKDLAERVGKKTGKKITPEAVRKWEKPAEEGGVKNLESANLYALADIFDINARRIALGPKNSPVRPLFPTLEEKELIELYRRMTDVSKSSFITLGRQILASQGTTV